DLPRPDGVHGGRRRDGLRVGRLDHGCRASEHRSCTISERSIAARSARPTVRLPAAAKKGSPVYRSLAVASLAAFVSLASFGLPAPTAQARVARTWRPVAAPPVSISIEGHDGRALPSVMHGGQMFVAGEQGERYEVRLTNNSGDRVEVVLSVDGRDAVSGRMADFRTQRGYVLEPFSSVSIDGFRTSLSSVAAFRFTSPGESFAGRSGTPGNAGVIGVAVFKERRQAIARGPMKRRASSGFVPFDAGAGTKSKGAEAPSPSA